MGIGLDRSHTVIMGGMTLAAASAAREAMKDDPQYVYVMVERDTE